MKDVSFILARALVTCALAGVAASPGVAQQAGPRSHSGEFAGPGSGEFTMTMGGKMPHQHKVTDATRFTRDGKPASLADLKPGDLIKVTTENGATLEVDATSSRASAAGS